MALDVGQVAADLGGARVGKESALFLVGPLTLRGGEVDLKRGGDGGARLGLRGAARGGVADGRGVAEPGGRR